MICMTSLKAESHVILRAIAEKRAAILRFFDPRQSTSRFAFIGCATAAHDPLVS